MAHEKEASPFEVLLHLLISAASLQEKCSPPSRTDVLSPVMGCRAGSIARPGTSQEPASKELAAKRRSLRSLREHNLQLLRSRLRDGSVREVVWKEHASEIDFGGLLEEVVQKACQGDMRGRRSQSQPEARDGQSSSMGRAPAGRRLLSASSDGTGGPTLAVLGRQGELSSAAEALRRALLPQSRRLPQ